MNFDPLIIDVLPLRAENTLYLDRDGVLNRAVMRGTEVSSPRKWEEFILCEDINALATEKISKNWNLIVVSNQPDLSRQRIDRHFMDRVHAEISKKIPINRFYICPHQSQDLCACRKPLPGMIEHFRSEFSRHVKKELFVGDRRPDLECATLSSIPFALVERSYNTDLISSSDLSLQSLQELQSFLGSQAI